MWTPNGEPVRQWLHNEKGLNDATIERARLGYNSADIYEPRVTWGLETAYNDNGKEKKQWLPAGLVIPSISNGNIQRLRIRRDTPSDGKRYVVVSGSSPAPLINGKDKAAYVIVESELDALLLAQEAGDLCGTVALGTATAKPDNETDKL